ncbi:MAG: host-nuclease inhibitor Gam family protein [Azoarcus sp.]|jgi:phage host-nuclease inhibitor protein Gam|nr:host-nuclease inhibitor Gam family protein [Azoarcus sp.]
MAKQKKLAAIYVCQSKDEVMGAIRELGDAQRELVRIEAGINDQIAAITDASKDMIDALKQRIDTLTNGIQIWCEAHRAAICAGGGKTANLITGEVSWRQSPPSVTVRKVDKVIDALKALGKKAFIRTKEEVNKEAILSNPNAVAGVPGITVVTGQETFAVTPFEVEVA